MIEHKVPPPVGASEVEEPSLELVGWCVQCQENTRQLVHGKWCVCTKCWQEAKSREAINSIEGSN